jgi:hypothetical protein
MMGGITILPVPGRWQRDALAEGGFVPTRRRVRRAPSTTLRAVPLPVPGRI